MDVWLVVIKWGSWWIFFRVIDSVISRDSIDRDRDNIDNDNIDRDNLNAGTANIS